MNDECTPCCAHRYLVHVTKRYMNGCQSDHWECQDCGVTFIPRLPPTNLDLPIDGEADGSRR
jgi:transposase-like protein